MYANEAHQFKSCYNFEKKLDSSMFNLVFTISGRGHWTVNCIGTHGISFVCLKILVLLLNFICLVCTIRGNFVYPNLGWISIITVLSGPSLLYIDGQTNSLNYRVASLLKTFWF